MVGNVAHLGKAPGHESGNYKTHLDTRFAFESDKKKDYNVKVVGCRKRDFGRTDFNMPMRVPYEALHEEFESDPTLSVRLREAIQEYSLPPSSFCEPHSAG